MNLKLIVIDTQALFDWLVFRDPACAAWSSTLDGREWQWIHTAAMKQEFDFVAAKGFGARWPVATDDLAAAWRRHARELAPPAPLGASERLRCTDPDDQKFIDLAIGAGARTLVSRDKAVLKLARRAAHHALRICRPAAWDAALAGTDQCPSESESVSGENRLRGGDRNAI